MARVWAADSKLKVGDPVPSVVGTTQDDQTLDLAKEGAHGYLLVYFYPKAMTPGCTAQVCSLRDAYADLGARGVRVIGVSLDSVANQQRFYEKEHLPFALIADTDRKVRLKSRRPATHPPRFARPLADEVQTRTVSFRSEVE